MRPPSPLLSNRCFLLALLSSPRIFEHNQAISVRTKLFRQGLRAVLPSLTDGPDALPPDHFAIRYFTDLLEDCVKMVVYRDPDHEASSGVGRKVKGTGLQAYHALSEGRGRIVGQISFG